MESRKCLTGSRDPWVSPVLVPPQWKRLRAGLWEQIPGPDPALHLFAAPGVEQGDQYCRMGPDATTTMTTEVALKRVQPEKCLEKKSRLDPGNVPLHLHLPSPLLRTGFSRIL